MQDAQSFLLLSVPKPNLLLPLLLGTFFLGSSGLVLNSHPLSLFPVPRCWLTLLLRILVAVITYKMGSLSRVAAQAQGCNTGGLDLAAFFLQGNSTPFALSLLAAPDS